METHKTILVVDDDPLVRKIVRLILSDEPYAVIEAQDGAEARVKLARVPVDLLVTDLEMPHVTGDQLILSERQNRSLPAILMTGKIGELELKEDSETRIKRKPFDPKQLIVDIKELCPPKSTNASRSGILRS